MSRNLKIMFCLIVVAALMAGSLTLASMPDKAPVPDGECRFANLECPNDFAPVNCKKGGGFTNRCYAKRACAKGCRNFFGG